MPKQTFRDALPKLRNSNSKFQTETKFKQNSQTKSTNKFSRTNPTIDSNTLTAWTNKNQIFNKKIQRNFQRNSNSKCLTEQNSNEISTKYQTQKNQTKTKSQQKSIKKRLITTKSIKNETGAYLRRPSFQSTKRTKPPSTARQPSTPRNTQKPKLDRLENRNTKPKIPDTTMVDHRSLPRIYL